MTRGAPCAIISAGLASTVLICFRTSDSSWLGCRIPCAQGTSGRIHARWSASESASRSDMLLPPCRFLYEDDDLTGDRLQLLANLGRTPYPAVSSRLANHTNLH